MKLSNRGPLKTFNVAFSEKTYDESSYARFVARYVETEHHEVSCTSVDFSNLLETIAWHADNLTADISMVPMYLLAKLAREHVTVVLSGDGGDEAFGGYLTYQADVLAHYYRRLPIYLRRCLIRPLIAALPSSSRKQSFDYKLRKFIEGAEFPPDKAHYIWRTIFSDEEKRRVLSSDLLEIVHESDTADCYRRHFVQANHLSEMDKIFYTDFKVFLVDSILAKVDSMTMAHALETRVPLLDYRLVELAASIPPGLKIKRLTTKHIFKRAMVPHLPRQIVFRKKEGFHPPLAAWFRHELRSFVNDVLCGENLRSMGIFNLSYVDELKRRHFAGVENNAFKLWGLMNFVAWQTRVLKTAVQ
jgi:asparagine synthase (glutamine-hydrolysing)